MTTTLDSTGFIDYAAFGVHEDDLSSLRALSCVWRSAVTKAAAPYGNSHLLDDFVARSSELPSRINDAAWQRSWMHAWHKLGGRGFSLADMFGVFTGATA